MRKVLFFLVLAQFLVCNGWTADAPKGEDVKRGIDKPKLPADEKAYDVSDTIKRGRQVILDQKEQLQVKEEPEEVKKEAAEEVAIEARRDILEQTIIQEVDVSRPTQAIEAELRREQYRQEIMSTAGKEVRPTFKKRRFNVLAKETYDDNVFLTKGNRKEDYITKISPSVLFNLNSKYVNLDANYVIDVVRYRFQEKQSGVNQLLYTDIRPGIVAFPFFKGRGGKIGLQIRDTFQPSITNVASNEVTSRTKRMTNDLLVLLDYYMSEKKTLSMEYENDFEHYDKVADRQSTYIENVITPKFYFRIRPKWSLMAGGDFGKRDYPKGRNDSVYYRIKGGATGRFFTKLISRFELGKEWRDYKDTSYGEAQALFFNGYFLSRFPGSAQASLSYRHSIVDSTTSGYPYYISDVIDFDFERKLTYKTRGLLGFTYAHDAYDREWFVDNVGKIRHDDKYEGSIAVRYYFKKEFYAELGYVYTMKRSNFRINNYFDSRVSAGVNAQF